MAAALVIPMRDDPDVLKLLDLLNTPGYQAEKQGFSSLINYVDVISEQYNNILDELTDLKDRIGDITDKKNPLAFMAERLASIVSGIGEKLKALKDSILGFCKDTLEATRDTGLSALGAVSEKLHIHEGLEAISKSLEQAAVKCESLEKFHQERVTAHEISETPSSGEPSATLVELLEGVRVDFENLTPDELNTVYAKLLDIGMNSDLTASENDCLQYLTEEAESLMPDRGEADYSQAMESEHEQGEEI